MSVDDIKPAEPIRPYVGNEQGQRKKRSGYGEGEGERKYPSPKSSIHDVTSFMGIPQDELTPAVTDAIISLMEEVDELREQIAMTHSLEHMLSDNADKHSDLPVLTRHALVREISVMCARIQKSGSASTFVYFQIKNSSEIRARSGLLAFEAVLRESAEILVAQLRETDRIGTLGGDGFGVIMALSTPEQAIDKVKTLASLVEMGPLMFEGHVINVEVAFGLHSMHETEDAIAVLRAADQDLHRRFMQT